MPQFHTKSGTKKIFVRWINDEGTEVDNTVLVFSWQFLTTKYEAIAYLA
jgi:hypothetical protein